MNQLRKRLKWAAGRTDRKREGRIVVVNGDDFGLSDAVNHGIARAHENGILSSASLMVEGTAAAGAVAYSKSHRRLGLGIHVYLGSWVFQNGEWIQQSFVVPIKDRAAVAAEVARQIDLFQELTERCPTHLDSHQHVHREEPAHSIMLETARRLNVPLRSYTTGVTYCGDYYGQTGQGAPLAEAISIESLARILASLPAGITELGCHPALGQNVGDPVYVEERGRELRALCDPRIRRILVAEGIEIRSFADLDRIWWS
jgi:predicted glycoside hydrolase/deacetylase ChbG (UPF0249 family)